MLNSEQNPTNNVIQKIHQTHPRLHKAIFNYLANNELTLQPPIPPRTAQNPFSQRPTGFVENPRSRSNSDYYHTVTGGRSDDIESSLLEGNMYKNNMETPSTLPMLDKMFKNQDMGK